MRRISIIAGICLLLGISLAAFFTYRQSERWEGAYVIAEVYQVGAQRIEMRGIHGEVLFAELTPKTSVWKGRHKASVADLAIGESVMVVGPAWSPERVRADTIRILTDYKIKRQPPRPLH